MVRRVRFKKGAASFYVVAFSTLILIIIATSFATVVLSELARTANDDLSQSAYDSALAGIEDAKLAYAEYQKCLNSGGSSRCAEIVSLIGSDDCDMVGKILGRYGNSDGSGSGEVMIKETYSSDGGQENNMQQAYTCVKIKTVLEDYSSTLTETDTSRAVRVRLHNNASAVDKVRITWGVDEEKTTGNKFDFRFSNINDGKVAFPSLKGDVQVARPPMISVGLVQTAESFSLNDFELTNTNATNRGTVFLVPWNGKNIRNDVDNRIDITSNNMVSREQIVKTNDRAVKNVPFVVYCNVDTDRNCSATLQLPKAINSRRDAVDRRNDTFMMVISNPYGEPKTKFSLEFYDAAGNLLSLSGMQIEIDSTGRANNLYRRVMARLEPTDTNFPYPLFGIELLGDGKGEGNLVKPGIVTCEYKKWTRFEPTCR